MAQQRANVQSFTHDLWAPLSHVIGDGLEPAARGGIVPTWVDEVDARRLLAYRALDAYLDNVRRYWLPAHMWQATPVQVDGQLVERGVPAAEGYREYGHPALLVNTARSLLLGEEQTVTAMNPDEQDSEVVAWTVGWAEDERLTAKVLEGEEACIGLGDTVYTVGWSPRVRRPRLRCYDPGMYFPDWAAVDDPAFTDWDDDDYPPIVHVAWEYTRPDGSVWLHRITWTMTRLDDLRSLPYAAGDFPPASWTCVYRVEEWDTSRLNGKTIYQLTPGSGTTLTDDTDLAIDFLPVVGVPNDYNKHRFGRSLLLRVAQLLDDLSSGDTDLQIDATLVASPPTVTAGVDAPLDSGPGAQWDATGGAINLLDTSKTLDALLKYADRLEDLLSTRARVSSVLLGKVDPTDAASGYAMDIGLAPTKALLAEMERVRKEKYPLLLKFAARIAMANGDLPAQDVPVMRLDLGSGLPSELDMTVDRVTKLLTAKAISTTVAVTMLRDAGVPIDDVDAEVARITAADTASAVQVVDATGDVDAARERLGLPPAPVPTEAELQAEADRKAAADAKAAAALNPTDQPVEPVDPAPVA